MEQQDILEFSSALFDAIESSDPDRKININQLYEGEVLDYIRCKECDGGSNRRDIFLNLSLPINSSLEQALENYLRPEVMSGSNAYACEKCNKKAEANKGVSFLSLPLILTIQLNRFCMDCITFHRVKINDRLIFPFVLNMNNYMNGFAEIRKNAAECEKRLEEELKLYYTNTEHNKIHSTEVKGKSEKKEEIKVEENTKNTIKEETNKELKEELTEEVKHKVKNEDREVKEQDKKSEVNNNKSYSIGPDGIINEFETEYTTNPLGKEENIGGISGVDLTEEERNNDYLWQTKPKVRSMIGGDQSYSTNTHYKQEQYIDIEVPYQLLKTEKEELEEAMQKISQMENQEKVDKLHKEQIDEYLKEGENVYELFAVNVHLGGAFGGHYIEYIKSFEDNKWYCFNDMAVTVASEWDVVKTFGDKESAKCAYMLNYRKVGIPVPVITSASVPEYLRNEIEAEKIQEEEYESMHRRELRRMSITVFYEGKHAVIDIQKDDTLRKFKEKIIEMYKIDAEVSNTRLRVYVKDRNIMLDVYSPDADDLTIEKLNISSFRFYTLEIKAPNEKFTQYTEDDIYLRLIIYNSSFTALDEESLPVRNLQVKKSATIKQLVESIAAELNVPASEEKLRVYRRHKGNTYQDSYFESIFYDEIMDTSIKDLFIFDGNCIYAETIDSEEDMKRSKWVKALEEDKAKLHILYNDPHISTTSDYSAGYENEVIISKNSTLRELKKLLAEKLSLNENEFIIKRQSKDGPELKELNQTLASLHFTRTTTIFIELGKPSNIDEYRLLLSEALISSNENDDTEFYEFIEWGDFNVVGSYTVFQIKDKLSMMLLQEKNIEVPPTHIRLRDRVGDKLGTVFLDSMELRYYGMHDSKTISFQILTEDEHFGVNNLIIMAREWNPQDWSLSERKEILINNTWRIHDLTYKLSECFPQYRNQIDLLSMAKLPTLWNFKRGEFLGLYVTQYITIVE
jgi:ubiquitin carboxyl-terminal hydrolase 47